MLGQAKAAIILFMVLHHYAPVQQQAILDNLWAESRFEPCVISPDHKHEGLAQWRDQRRYDLHYLTQSKGCVSVANQMWFLDYELRHCRGSTAFFAATTIPRARALFRSGFEQGRWKC